MANVSVPVVLANLQAVPLLGPEIPLSLSEINPKQHPPSWPVRQDTKNLTSSFHKNTTDTSNVGPWFLRYFLLNIHTTTVYVPLVPTAVNQTLNITSPNSNTGEQAPDDYRKNVPVLWVNEDAGGEARRSTATASYAPKTVTPPVYYMQSNYTYAALSSLQIKVIIAAVVVLVVLCLKVCIVRLLCPRSNSRVCIVEDSAGQITVVHGIRVYLPPSGQSTAANTEESTKYQAPVNDLPPSYEEVTNPNRAKLPEAHMQAGGKY